MSDKKLDYKEVVDRLGVVREQIKTLQAEDKELAEKLKDAYNAGDTIHGGAYSASITESTSRVVLVDKVFKALGKERFLKVATVTMTALKNVMSLEQIDGVTAVGESSKTIRIKKN